MSTKQSGVYDYAKAHSRRISWDRLRRDAYALAALLKQKRFRGIVAVARGGLIPAGIIARILDIRRIECLSVASYMGPGGRKQGRPRLLNANAAGDGRGFLVIDDLTDSGRTFAFLRKRLPKATYAAIYAKPDGAHQADVYAHAVPQDVWLVFPWDQDPA